MTSSLSAQNPIRRGFSETVMVAVLGDGVRAILRAQRLRKGIMGGVDTPRPFSVKASATTNLV